MNTFGRRLSLALAGGACLAVSFPPLAYSPQAFLAFLAPALFLHALRGARTGEAALVGWLFGLVGTGFPARWIVPALASSGHPIVGIAVLGGLALPAVLVALLHAVSERRTDRRTLVVLVTAFWIAIEWEKGLCPVVPMSWFTLGHALGTSPPLCQWASIVGIHGLSLLALVSAFLLEAAIHEARARAPGRAVVRVVVGLGLPVVAWELGFFVLVSAVPIEAALHGAFSSVLVQSSDSVELEVALSRVGMTRAFLDRTPKVDAIVWPEGAWPDWRGDPFEGGTLAAPLRPVAALAESAFIFGCHRPAPSGERWDAVLAVDRRGELLAEYHKREPEPYLEPRAEPGSVPVVFRAGRYVVGLAIGTDGSHPEILRELALAGADIIVIPSRDPEEWPLAARIQHACLYPVRACETRRPILRAGTVGLTFSVDELGRSYSELHTDRPSVLIGRLAGTGAPTLYMRGGYRLPHVALAIAVSGMLLLLLRPRYRARSPDAAASAIR